VTFPLVFAVSIKAKYVIQGETETVKLVIRGFIKLQTKWSWRNMEQKKLHRNSRGWRTDLYLCTFELKTQ